MATTLEKISDGRTDLVFDYLVQGYPATAKDSQGVSLLQRCAYYGDLSAIRFLLQHGESLNSLGENLGLNAAAFHGHWRLCQFLLEQGADANQSAKDNGETPLHSAIVKVNRLETELVVRVLLTAGANPNCATKRGTETGAFMRDCRTKGETPLHRAAAFADEKTIQLLLDAGALLDAKDANGDSPLSWASWYLRPDAILRKLCYGPFSVREGRQSMERYLLGEPHN